MEKTVQDNQKQYWFGLGRRKTAVAKVKLVKGTGKFIINDKDISVPSRVYMKPLRSCSEK